jgi:prophage regulatory protein
MSRRILRLAEVLARTGYSKSTLRRKELAGEVGRRLRLGPNSVGWYEDEIEAHVASRPRMPLPESKEEEVLRVGVRAAPGAVAPAAAGSVSGSTPLYQIQLRPGRRDGDESR